MNGLISLDNITLKPIESEITELNAESSKYGLVLSEEDVHSLAVVRTRSIKENDRIEIGTGAVPAIVKKFCTSRFITQENYSYILEEVTYIFYYIKTEVDDKITDAELVDELFNRFELQCRGSIDTLISRESEKIIRKVNSGEKYHDWFSERDELDYTDAKGSREAPENQLEEAYGEDYFRDDTLADHDKYETDTGEGENQPDDSLFSLDAFDEFFEQNAVLNGTDDKKRSEKKEEIDDD